MDLGITSGAGEKEAKWMGKERGRKDRKLGDFILAPKFESPKTSR